MTDTNAQTITVDYTNWRGERRVRKITPTGRIWFGCNEWHLDPQWLVEAVDCEDGKTKTFALAGLRALTQPAPDLAGLVARWNSFAADDTQKGWDESNYAFRVRAAAWRCCASELEALASQATPTPGATPSDGTLADCRETFQRLADLTPNRANAATALDLHHTVAAIAKCAIDRIDAPRFAASAVAQTQQVALVNKWRAMAKREQYNTAVVLLDCASELDAIIKEGGGSPAVLHRTEDAAPGATPSAVTGGAEIERIIQDMQECLRADCDGLYNIEEIEQALEEGEDRIRSLSAEVERLKAEIDSSPRRECVTGAQADKGYAQRLAEAQESDRKFLNRLSREEIKGEIGREFGAPQAGVIEPSEEALCQFAYTQQIAICQSLGEGTANRIGLRAAYAIDAARMFEVLKKAEAEKGQSK